MTLTLTTSQKATVGLASSMLEVLMPSQDLLAGVTQKKQRTQV